MTNENQSVTPEQYKTELLKRNFANRVAEYEDAIASLQTENQMLKQTIEESKNVEVPEEAAPEVDFGEIDEVKVS